MHFRGDSDYDLNSNKRDELALASRKKKRGFTTMINWPYISKECFHIIKIHQKTLFQLVRDKKIKYK